MKNSKNQGQNAACEKKTLARKQIFVQTPYSDYTPKFKLKISCRKTTRLFAPLHVSA